MNDRIHRIQSGNMHYIHTAILQRCGLTLVIRRHRNTQSTTAGVYWCDASLSGYLDDGNERIRIREKTLQFSTMLNRWNGVICKISSPYLKQLQADAHKHCWDIVFLVFGRPLQVTVHPMHGTVVLSVLSVTLVYCGQTVGWIKLDGTWCGGRPRLKRHCVGWRPSSPHGKGHSSPPYFSAHVYCGQTVAHLSNCWALVKLAADRHLAFVIRQLDRPWRVGPTWWSIGLSFCKISLESMQWFQ